MNIRRAETLSDFNQVSEIFTCNEYLEFGILSRHTCQQALLKTMLDQSEQNTRYYLCEQNNEVVVVFVLSRIDFYNRNAEVHIATSFSEKNIHYFYLTVRRILEIAFNDLKLNRLYGETTEWNIYLVRIVQLLGGSIEGILERGLFCDGIWHRSVFLGLSRYNLTYGKWREKHRDFTN